MSKKHRMRAIYSKKYRTVVVVTAELSMGRLDQARTRAEPEDDLKL